MPPPYDNSWGGSAPPPPLSSGANGVFLLFVATPATPSASFRCLLQRLRRRRRLFGVWGQGSTGTYWCFSFPYRLTPELCAIPRLGAVNLHPAVLPAYRGPNVFRSFYEGWPEFGATTHWIAEEFDTGNILSQKAAPLPEEVTPENIYSIWGPLISETFAEGLERAIAGDPGIPQDDSQASYAAPFTEAETWLDLSEPQRVIQRKVTALNFGPETLAKVRVNDDSFVVTAVSLLPQQTSTAQPGTCLERNEETLLVQAADGPIRLQIKPMTGGNEL